MVQQAIRAEPTLHNRGGYSDVSSGLSITTARPTGVSRRLRPLQGEVVAILPEDAKKPACRVLEDPQLGWARTVARGMTDTEAERMDRGREEKDMARIPG